MKNNKAPWNLCIHGTYNKQTDLYKKKRRWGRRKRKVRKEKAVMAKPDDLILILGSHMVKTETGLPQVIL